MNEMNSCETHISLKPKFTSKFQRQIASHLMQRESGKDESKWSELSTAKQNKFLEQARIDYDACKEFQVQIVAEPTTLEISKERSKLNRNRVRRGRGKNKMKNEKKKDEIEKKLQAKAMETANRKKRIQAQIRGLYEMSKSQQKI